MKTVNPTAPVIQKRESPHPLLNYLLLRGAEGIRTPDPLHAMQVLCRAELQPHEPVLYQTDSRSKSLTESRCSTFGQGTTSALERTSCFLSPHAPNMTG